MCAERWVLEVEICIMQKQFGKYEIVFNRTAECPLQVMLGYWWAMPEQLHACRLCMVADFAHQAVATTKRPGASTNEAGFQAQARLQALAVEPGLK
jgi:hypothetical protein